MNSIKSYILSVWVGRRFKLDSDHSCYSFLINDSIGDWSVWNFMDWFVLSLSFVVCRLTLTGSKDEMMRLPSTGLLNTFIRNISCQ